MTEERILISGDHYLGGLLLFFYRTIRRHLLLLVLPTVVVAALAFVVARQLPEVYSAQVSLRIGQVDGAATMNVQDTVLRINSPSFKRHVLQSMNFPADDDRSAQLVLTSLTARPETANTVAVFVRATTEQDVRRALDVTVRLLNEEQEKIRGPLIADVNQQLATSDANIARLLQAKDSASALMKATFDAPAPDSAAAISQRIWLLDLVSRNEQQLANAQTDRRTLAMRLSPLRTFPTALVDVDSVAPALVSLRPKTAMIVGGALTFLACLLYALALRPKTAGARR